MIPGEYVLQKDPILCNANKQTRIINVVNRGDRPIQIGSHYHFAEANPSLEFDRLAARGMRLDSPAGAAVRFEPGDARSVHLVEFGGTREIYGFRDEVNGPVGPSVSLFSTEAIGGTAGFDIVRDEKLVRQLEQERAAKAKELQFDGDQYETHSPVKNSTATDEDFDAPDDSPTNSTISESRAVGSREIERLKREAEAEAEDGEHA